MDSTREASALLRVEAASKRYADGTEAVRSVDLTVRRGEFVSLLGASGCGKSTLLRMVAGLSPPTSGAVRWLDAPAGPRRDIGFVFQEPTLMPWASVWDNVYLPLRLAGVNRRAAAERIERTLASVGLAEFARSYPSQLSGGMKMRVSLARALVIEPRILLMDEPFAALDEITRFKLNDELLSLFAQRDLTVLFVTHSVFESVYLSTRILVMSPRPGRIADEIDVEGPMPRDAGFRTSTPYVEQCRIVSDRLQAATA